MVPITEIWGSAEGRWGWGGDFGFSFRCVEGEMLRDSWLEMALCSEDTREGWQEENWRTEW